MRIGFAQIAVASDATPSRTGLGRRKLWAARIVAFVAAVVALALASIAVQPAAFAADFPSWDDVQRARGQVDAQQQLIGQIQSQLGVLQSEAAAAESDAQAKGLVYQEAESAYQAAAFDAQQKQDQADQLQSAADESKRRAALAAAQLARTGNSDPTATMLGDPKAADDLLSMLGSMGRITEMQQAVYEKAQKDQNAAKAASEQAEVARTVREQAKVEAQAAADAASAAQAAAQAAVDAQVEQQAVAEAQLTVLRENREATEADYEAGVRERERIAREEADRKARERAEAEAAARAAAAAAAANSGGGGGGGGGTVVVGGGGTGGVPAQSGWARPSSGGISSAYGYRIHPIHGTRIFHEGVDFAPGCGAPIYAAAAGTVSYSGWYGGYGNYIRISHGDGITTAYGHIVNGGLLVRSGQQVDVGDIIARVGTTGDSTGCHLHFEVRNGGVTTDPISFLRARGAI